jgi:type IX secretion system PorP/SprF family membrane protein
MKRMKRSLLFLLIFFGSICVFAQQRPQYSQYMVNQFVLNPALAGTEEFIDLKAGFRYQWLGMSSAPVSYYLSGHMPLGRPQKSSFGKHKNQKSGWHGLGAYLYNDITGPIRHTAGYLAYAYNLPLSKNVRMSLGANAGIQRFGLNGNDFILKDENDLVLNGVKSTVIPDAGTWLYGKTWYYGLAVHQLLQNELVFNGVREIGGPNGSKGMSKLNNHYFMTAGYFYKFKHDYAIVPSVMIKYVNPAPVSIDISAKFVFKDDIFWFGASYRGLDSFTGIIGTTLFNGTMPISYSYDLSHSELIKYNTGSHEVVIGYRIPPNPRVPCPNKFWN